MRRTSTPHPATPPDIQIPRAILRAAVLDVLQFHREQFLIQTTGDRLAVSLRNQAQPGRAAASLCAALTITNSRPPYYAEPTTPPASTDKRFWLRLGTVNDVVPTDIDQPIDLTVSTGIRGISLKVSFSTGATRLTVTGVDIETHDPATPPTPDDWGVDGELPGYSYVPLGVADPETGAIENYGLGSVSMFAPLTAIVPAPGGPTSYTREITYFRAA